MLSRRLDVTNSICWWMTEDASLVPSLSRGYWKLHDISVTMTDFSWVNKHYELLTGTDAHGQRDETHTQLSSLLTPWGKKSRGVTTVLYIPTYIHTCLHRCLDKNTHSKHEGWLTNIFASWLKGGGQSQFCSDALTWTQTHTQMHRETHACLHKYRWDINTNTQSTAESQQMTTSLVYQSTFTLSKLALDWCEHAHTYL